MLVGPVGEPCLTVVIVLWNCEQFLDACINPLIADPLRLQVVCVDNASDDDSASRAAALGCEVIRLETNAGFPHAVNAALPSAAASTTLLLNPDVRVEPGTLRRCIDVLAGDSTIGLVGANLRRPDGRPDPPAARRFRSLASITLESFGLAHVLPRLNIQYFPGWDRTSSRDVPCINGAFAMLSTDLFRSFGGLDDTVFLYLEDQELCRSVATRGLRVRFVADAPAAHVGGGPTEASSATRRATAYLHRLDASIEIVARREGQTTRLLAIAVLMARCGALLAVSLATQRADAVIKYRGALRWLARQPRRRRPPPPVP